MITAATAVLAMVVPAVAQAEPAANDDFDASTVISAVPFAVQSDTSEATRADDDPVSCQRFDTGGTVWFSITPTEDVLLRATTAGSDHGTILSAYTGGRGALTGVPGTCGTGGTMTFRANAGTTYHLMVAGFDVPGGALSFGLDIVAPAANDGFANAEPIAALPGTRQPDLSIASFEADEPASRCANPLDQSVWYTFTPAGAVSVVAQLDQFRASVTVYTGSALPDLRELTCGSGTGRPALFRANPGVTYYLRVTEPVSSAGLVTFGLAEAPALQPFFGTSPFDPSIYDQTTFGVDAGDPLNQPIVGGQWDFGDGTTAPVTNTPPTHHYTVDGTYQVSVSIVTQDGRVGTRTAPVTVKTHDVSITKFDTPVKARTGQTKPITVHIANTRYPETVTVDLFRVDGFFGTLVGTLTLDVPARPSRTTQFPFAYTFSAADAVLGKVTFRAVVRMTPGFRDARPQDNEVIAISTTVLPSLTDLRFA